MMILRNVGNYLPVDTV